MASVAVVIQFCVYGNWLVTNPRTHVVDSTPVDMIHTRSVAHPLSFYLNLTLIAHLTVLACSGFCSGIANILYAPATCEFALICSPHLCAREGPYYPSLSRALGRSEPIYLEASLFAATTSEEAGAGGKSRLAANQAYSVVLGTLVPELKELAARFSN